MIGPYPYARFQMPFAYAADSTGTPLVGGQLYFYVSGTSEPLDTYADPALSRPNTNPVVADASGSWPAIFLAQQNYKVVLVDVNGNTIWSADPVAPVVIPVTIAQTTVVIECTIDGNNQTPQTGVCGDAYCPVACTLSSAVMQADVAGSAIIDVWVAPFVTNTPPTNKDSITASDPPTLSSSVSSIDTVLSGWTLQIPAGSALRFNINSISDLTRVSLTLVGTTS